MAHELEMSDDGRASFFYIGDSAWHGLGEQLGEGTDLAAAIHQARIDYPVAVEPVYRRRIIQVPTPGVTETVFLPSGDSFDRPVTEPREVYEESEVARVTVRTDTGKELGRVSPDYVVVQNVDAFQVMRPLLDAGLARLEAGGVLRDGQDAWILVQLAPKPGVEATGTDTCASYVLCRTNHSGRAGVLFALTKIRVVCANTLRMVEARASGGQSRSVRHTGDAEARLADQARDLLARFRIIDEATELEFRALRATFLDQALFRELVLDVAVPLPTANPRFKADGRAAASVIDRAEHKRTEITRLWSEGMGHVGDHSAWEAYNGLVEAIDHRPDLFAARDRLASLCDGRLSSVRDRVFDGLLAHAEMQQ